MEKQSMNSSSRNYLVGQKFHWAFFVSYNRKIQTNFWASPILLILIFMPDPKTTHRIL